MPLWSLVLLAVLADSPAAEVETLKGDRQTGQLEELTESRLRLQTSTAAVDFPLADVLSVRFPAAMPPDPSSGTRVALVDGTRLACSEFSVQNSQAKLVTMQCGTLTVPIARVAQVRFGISTAKLDEGWNALLNRDSKTDLLVIRKEDILDHLDGVAGDVGEKIGFLLDGDEVPVAREKVYGIIFRRKAGALPKATCQLDLTGGDQLQAVQVTGNAAGFRARLAAGVDATLATTDITSLDFSAGKIRYLSQLEPRDVKYVPYFDLVSEYRRDRSLDGKALSLGGKTYARGLAIHSKTTLRYRIAGEYTRLKAVMGIDDSVCRQYAVRVTISGDGKALFEGDVRGTDAPRPLDLDVTGVRDLEILVDFGGDLDSCDHLDLADAKLLK
ncbi:MAG TPA: NPCBM/NEW2 domain-containing protein [Planctomycetaceae bacterium]|nr:NPCBM/NEW2 domain-containing protein [Planctomycetaceae bacterium]